MRPADRDLTPPFRGSIVHHRREFCPNKAYGMKRISWLHATHRKKNLVEPVSLAPYLMVVCLARSSADLMGVVHAAGGEEGSQVGRVGGDHDEGEHPPPGGHHPRRYGPGTAGGGSDPDQIHRTGSDPPRAVEHPRKRWREGILTADEQFRLVLDSWQNNLDVFLFASSDVISKTSRPCIR